MWPAVERDSARSWAIKIYEKLKTDLKAKKIVPWYTNYFTTLMNCRECMVESGCCKKRKLTLAMTSQILHWFKKHKKELKANKLSA